MSIEAMKQALEALEAVRWSRHLEDARTIAKNARYSLRQAIEQAEKQIPTTLCGPNLEQTLNAAGFYRQREQWDTSDMAHRSGGLTVEQNEWVGLTDEEIHKIIDDCTPDEAELEELNDFAKAIFAVEAKLKERNNG
jgi:hypothetical protein